jgi:hypothetical protein
MTGNDIHEIKQVIEESYVRGIHEEQNRTLVDKGFHPVFEMLVLDGTAVSRVNVEEWMPRIASMKEANPDMWAHTTSHEFKLVDIAGNAAVAKLEVYKGDTFFSTDYMLLYKVGGKWQIVSKVYSV